MRRESRELTLQILFQAEFAPEISTRLFVEVFENQFDAPTIAYAQELIDGVRSNKVAIDELIQTSSQHWKINRMSTVDRNILRLAVYEMKFAPEPLKGNIVINEAVDIARKYGTTDSASFVNGLLDQVSKT